MSRAHTFTPDFKTVATLPGLATIEALSNEVGVYSASPAFIRRECGPIAHAFLDAVPDWYYDEADRLGLWPNADVRIHRLYPGDIPAYPGWHCDGEYRETYFSQPDLDKIPVSRHLTGTVSTSPDGVSNTQFLAQTFDVTLSREPDAEVTLWGMVHRAVEAVRPLAVNDTRDGELVCFGPRALHRAMPARVRGWRLFFRMSMWHRPNLGDGGKRSRQEQVYKTWEGGGW